MSDANHLPLRSINHLSFVVSCVETSLAFYRDILGFIVIQRPSSFNESFEGCWLWRYGLGLHLIKGKPVPRPSHIDPKNDHMSFQADSLDVVEQQLSSRGMPYVKQLVVEGALQVQQLFFHDPDNNMIEVCNCDCLPIIPLDVSRCQSCATEAGKLAEQFTVTAASRLQLQQQLNHDACGSGNCGAAHLAGHLMEQHLMEDVEAIMSDGSRDSMDSSRSEHMTSAAASVMAAAAQPTRARNNA